MQQQEQEQQEQQQEQQQHSNVTLALTKAHHTENKVDVRASIQGLYNNNYHIITLQKCKKEPNTL